MHWYSVGDFFIHIAFLLEWINNVVWGIYDPATDSRISPCAWKNECIGMHPESDPILRTTCLSTPNYCAFTEASTIILCCIFCVVVVSGACLLCCCFSEKTRLRQKEKKLDHNE